VNPSPVLNLGNDTVITNGNPVTLHAGTGFVSYQWNNFSTADSLVASASGQYSVCISDSNNCVSCDTIEITIINGIEQLAMAGNISLYPNPAHTSVTIELMEQLSGAVNITLANVQGQVISREEMHNLAAGYMHTMNVSKYAAGIYYLRIQSEEGLAVYRLVIE
jgi:hypothetical protein